MPSAACEKEEEGKESKKKEKEEKLLSTSKLAPTSKVGLIPAAVYFKPLRKEKKERKRKKRENEKRERKTTF